MKTLMISLVGAAFMASLSPVMVAAQGVQVEVPGVGVRVGDPDRRDRDRDRDRENRRGGNTGDCRTVTVKHERPDGTTVTRQERKCD